jgi:Family of unknown function (DUF6519)/Right handed beta helix region
MSGDYSRKTFDPFRDFSGVLMQQGRVQLDADWNELVGIISRRLRAETTDIIGRGTVPTETPDGFKIEISGGTLTIGRGRIYVDGLLAENHGKLPLEFDTVLGEQRGTLAVPYDEQPYFPNAVTVAPAPTEGGPYLVYLDVWQREVTYLQVPELIEKAVGVDTATRLQTVWQVRVLRDVDTDVTCDTPDDGVGGWLDIIRPSDGRLSTDAVGVVTPDDPCVIPPSGGYRGLENRLYHVEIHDGGSTGTATFKWSQNNASIATSVTAITALDKLTVARVGRDNTLRFNVGDWIEITDDFLEFAQQPGLMRQVKDVDDATQIITLTAALPAGMFPTDAQGNTDPKRHTRITRWDQKGKVTDTNNNLIVDLDAPGSKGLIPVPLHGTSIILEDGVQITFDTPTNGIYRVADFWCFAARTADASVEKLVEAPPRGIHHHYCRLAIVTFPNPPTDCRHLWPPPFGEAGCDCSVCVTAESHNSGTLTIQQAIDQVKDIGGTVCLGVGVYNLSEPPIVINSAKSLRVRGHDGMTVLVYPGEDSAISIEDSSGVTIEDLALLTASRGNTVTPAIAIRNSSAVTLQRNTILRVGVHELAIAAVGLAGVLIGVIIRENFIFGATGIGRFATARAPRLKRGTKATVGAASEFALLTAGLVIQDNTFDCSFRGVDFDGVSLHAFQTLVARNLISRCTQRAINMLGTVFLPGSGVDVRDNEIHTSGTGIVIGSDDARIENNGIAPTKAGEGNDGILLTHGLDRTGVARCQILSNRVLAMAGNGIRIASVSVGSAMIKNNFIQAVGAGGIAMDDDSQADVLSIENNQLFSLSPQSNDANTPVVGVRVVRARHADISGNVVIGLGAAAVQSPSCSAVQVLAATSTRIAGNQLADIGPASEFLGQGAGIECGGTFEHLEIAENNVRRNQSPPGAPDRSQWVAVLVRSPGHDKPAGGVPPHFIALAENVFGIFEKKIFASTRGREMVTVHSNFCDAYGEARAVFVGATGALSFNDNRCLFNTLRAPVAEAEVGAAIASSNYLLGPRDLTALVMRLPDAAPFTVLGNITTGPIEVNGNPLTPPWVPLNIIAV